MAVGTVKINLEASTAKFERQMQNFSKKLDKQIGSITSGLKKIGIAATAAAVGLGVMTKSAINSNDELSKLSTKLGITTEDLSALAFAGDFAGSSLNDLDKGLSAFVRRFNDFDKGAGLAKDAFEALGIQTRDSQGNLKDLNTAFLETAEAISKLPEGIEKTAIAQDIFSKNQAKLLPLLNEGKGGLEAFRKEAERLGLIIDGKTAKASEAFNDQLDLLGKTVSGFSQQLASRLLPTLTRVVDEVIRFTKTQDFEDVLNTIRTIVQALVVVFKSLILAVQGLGIVLDSLAGNTDRADASAKKFLVTLDKVLKDLKAIGSEEDFSISVTAPKGDNSPTTGDIFGKEDEDKVKTFKEQMEDFYKTITDLNTQFADAFKNAFQGLEDSVLGFVKTGKFEFKDLANSIIDDISRIAIKQAIIAPISQAASSAFGGLFGGKSGGITDIFGGFFAKGGRPDSGKVSVVGENGPELFIPDTSGRVIPNNQLSTGSNEGSGTYNKADVSITINAIDTQTGVSFLIANKDVISGIINTNLGTNGSTRSLI